LYVIRDAATGKRLTSGHTTQVAVNTATRELQWETPSALRDKLCPYLR
jgi:acyl-CoA thioester hydrolase